MIYSPRFTAILDACVLYPAPIRDILLNLADLEIYAPKWSEIIQEEWIRNLLENRPDLSKRKLQRTAQTMNAAFPDAEVHSFEELIDLIELPDPGDRHVLAAGIKCKADAIITFNAKDFPTEDLDQYDIEVYTPDEFVNLLNKLGYLSNIGHSMPSAHARPRLRSAFPFLLANIRQVATGVCN